MMATPFNQDAVLDLIGRRPGIADYEIAVEFFGEGTPGLAVKDVTRALARDGVTRRVLRKDGLLGNWLAEAARKRG
jgi:hypothetical protein